MCLQRKYFTYFLWLSQECACVRRGLTDFMPYSTHMRSAVCVSGGVADARERGVAEVGVWLS